MTRPGGQAAWMPSGRYPISFKIPNWSMTTPVASCGDLTGTRQGFPAPPGPRLRHLTEIAPPRCRLPLVPARGRTAECGAHAGFQRVSQFGPGCDSQLGEDAVQV